MIQRGGSEPTAAAAEQRLKKQGTGATLVINDLRVWFLRRPLCALLVLLPGNHIVFNLRIGCAVVPH